jgi:hypothetical protein
MSFRMLCHAVWQTLINISKELNAPIIRVMSKLHTPWPSLNGTASLPIADSTTFTGYTVHTWSWSPSCPYRQKEIGNFLGGGPQT